MGAFLLYEKVNARYVRHGDVRNKAMKANPSSKSSRRAVDCCIKGCFLCNEINDSDALSRHLGLYDKPLDKFIAQSEHFVVLFDIRPIVRGHALLVTRNHQPSMAQIPPTWYDELRAIKAEATAWIARHYRTPFCFEHGAAVGDVASGICVEHAHLHLIPAEVCVEDAVKDYVSGPIELKPIELTGALSHVIGSYLYYESSHGLGFLLHPQRPVPQQFIRQVVAASCGLSEWDWKEVALPYLL